MQQNRNFEKFLLGGVWMAGQKGLRGSTLTINKASKTITNQHVPNLADKAYDDVYYANTKYIEITLKGSNGVVKQVKTIKGSDPINKSDFIWNYEYGDFLIIEHISENRMYLLTEDILFPGFTSCDRINTFELASASTNTIINKASNDINTIFLGGVWMAEADGPRGTYLMINKASKIIANQHVPCLTADKAYDNVYYANKKYIEITLKGSDGVVKQVKTIKGSDPIDKSDFIWNYEYGDYLTIEHISENRMFFYHYNRMIKQGDQNIYTFSLLNSGNSATVGLLSKNQITNLFPLDGYVVGDGTPYIYCMGRIYAMCYKPNRLSEINIPAAFVAFTKTGSEIRRYLLPTDVKVTSIMMERDGFLFKGNRIKESWSSKVSFEHLDLPSFKATKEDILFVAELFKLTITSEQAQSLADALPEFNCYNCSVIFNNDPRVHIGKRSVTSDWTIGAIIGGAIGGAIGGLLGGPAGAIIGSGLGAGIGGQVGLAVYVDVTRPQIHVPISLEKDTTTVSIPNWAIGPFDNNNLISDIITRLGSNIFFRYGDSGASQIGALARAKPGSNELRVFYPTEGNIRDIKTFVPNATQKIASIGGKDTVFRFIFVVVEISPKVYQLRLSPDAWDPNNGKDRIMHSQLSIGSAFAALTGYNSMKVFAAGELFVYKNPKGIKELVGMTTKSGHYFESFFKVEDKMREEAIGLISKLGYDTSTIVRHIDNWELIVSQMDELSNEEKATFKDVLKKTEQIWSLENDDITKYIM